ncbi:Uncharacterised protein [Bordetella pertussis]|nr:Uncharacterised protein [Bordetella pertussis]CPN14935.1 Uncharacterised protein [Bordetella pertussis]
MSTCQGLAPSTRAASSSSRGTVLKVWRSRKMPKAEAKYGKPTANTVSRTPSRLIER